MCDERSARREASRAAGGAPPLVAHIIFRLDVGGLENGLVNLVNHMPAERFRHAIVSLTDASEFRRRIRRPDVAVYCLHKPPGNSIATQLRLWRLLRRLRPDIVHTRNLAALECTVAAALAGCRIRVHGEHGRDVADPDGTSLRRQAIRRLYKPFVHRYVAVSADLARYLRTRVGVDEGRVSHICNGVDIGRFHPRGEAPAAAGRSDTGAPFVIGTAGRMDPVKDPLNLVRAFCILVERMGAMRGALRLAMAGDGPLRKEVVSMLRRAGLEGHVSVTGPCSDMPAFMRGLDVFVLPSLGEGISNTILEAMASGVPVIATRVGGNPELVQESVSGLLVPPADPHALADAMACYIAQPDVARRHGAAGRQAAEQRYGLQAMVRNYEQLYDELLAPRRSAAARGDRKADASCAG
jgi:sugar transferase (PEP-CTERM/EpsH1 system associated)